MTVADVFRILTVELGVAMILLTLVIVVRYIQVNRLAPRAVPHLLPLHVGTIAAAFIVLAGSGMAEMILRIGQPATWRVPALFLGFSLANIAQSAMYSVVKAHLAAIEAKKKAT